MRIELYQEKYKESLNRLLIELSSELYGLGEANIEHFVSSHSMIYLAIDEELVVGFNAYAYNDCYGMNSPTIANTYMYVMPEYRGSKASYLLSMQTGKIIEDNEFPLELVIASDGSERILRKLKGKKTGVSFIYMREDVVDLFNQLKKKVRLK